MDRPTAGIAGRIEPVGRPVPPSASHNVVADLIAQIETAMRDIRARPLAGANDRGADCSPDYSIATRRALP